MTARDSTPEPAPDSSIYAAGALIGARYRLLEPLGQGAMGRVWCATDRLTQKTVALKRVMTTVDADGSQDPEAGTTFSLSRNVALAGEFEMLAGLHHPNIIQVLDYGFDAEGPYYTMDYLARADTIVDAGRAVPLIARVGLLIQTLQALAYLHRNAIVHRDLKPGNILAQNGTVKLLDFGLSVVRGHAPGVAGTLDYIAPEILLRETPSEVSDLYAVGVIAYELFAGAHPYPQDDSSVSHLLNDILHKPPDLDLLNFAEAQSGFPPTLPDTMREIIGKLLAKDPADRYQDGHDVIVDLSAALEQPAIARESAAVRDSFLQAARFVGREDEIDQLRFALTEAIGGRGSAWLIGGESGIGKSRLLEELRVPALVYGAVVLSGQAMPDGGLPYQLWRAPLRRLVLSVAQPVAQPVTQPTPLTDLAVGVLKPIVPDIERLLERDSVANAVPLNSVAAQQRLIGVMLSLFRALATPVVLLLDDLQWAGESLGPLRELIRIIHDLPVLVVGNFRSDDQAGFAGDFANELPGMTPIMLDRFPRDQIKQLSESMLGNPGLQPRIIDFLERETEGNVFFMIETLRALAEKAGALSAVTTIDLPDRMFPAGVRAIAQRRLDQLPLDYHPLLRIAAVAGRELDLNILRHIDPVIDMNRWLAVCAEAGMFRRIDGAWLFAHGKLRDGILNGLAADQPPKLHRLVAQAIETIYPDAEQNYARALLHHWHMGGDPAKEIHFARLVGQQSLIVSDYQGALKLFDRALDLAASLALTDSALDPDTQRDVLALRIQRAETVYNTGDYMQARAALDDAMQTALDLDDAAGIITITRIQGYIAQVSGDYESARERMQQSLDAADAAGDRSGVARALRNLGLIAENTGDMDAADQLYRRSLRLFWELEDRVGTAGALANLGSIANHRGLYGEAEQQYGEALNLFRAIGYRWGVAYALIRLGELRRIAGDYATAETILADSLRICREIGHRWGMAFGQIQLGYVLHDQRNYLGAMQAFHAGLDIAASLQTTPTILEAVVGCALCLSADEEPARAAELLTLVLEHPAADSDTRRRATTILNALISDLDPDMVRAAAVRSRSLDLAAVVDDLLDEMRVFG